jgi:predicted Zn-dependent protease
MAALDSLPVEPSNVRAVLRRASLMARAYAAVGQPDSGRALLESIRQQHPDDPRIQAMVQRALERLTTGETPPAR